MESTSQAQTEPTGQTAAVFELKSAETFDAFYRRELAGLVAFARALSGSASAEDIAKRRCSPPIGAGTECLDSTCRARGFGACAPMALSRHCGGGESRLARCCVWDRDDQTSSR